MDVDKYQRIIELEIGKLKREEINLTKDKQQMELSLLGVSNKSLRKLKIEGIYLLSQEEQFKILTYAYKNTLISEVITWCLMRLDSFEINFLVSQKEKIILLSHSIQTWWHCDLLTKLYANILDKKRIFLKDLTELTKSTNIWQRRLSLTSLLYYSTQRENPLEFEIVSHQVKMLFDDQEYYVQKGLGWTLRELYNLYPEKTIEFLEIYIKDLSSIAFQSACEKVPKEKRDEFKNLRKSAISNPDEFEKKPAFERL